MNRVLITLATLHRGPRFRGRRAIRASSSWALPRTRPLSLALLIAAVLIAPASLRTLAYASPPDPSWIHGIYDDADFDDVVVFITSGTANLGPAPPADLEPTRLLVEKLITPVERVDLAIPESAVRSRAPPSS